jgi:hypothetical protein
VDNIKLDLGEINAVVLNRLVLFRTGSIVNAVMNLQVPLNVEKLVQKSTEEGSA